jgi:3,4-dihydroxy 2-butanone 4-phosphate synthase/GTP cyclohydrolase II
MDAIFSDSTYNMPFLEQRSEEITEAMLDMVREKLSEAQSFRRTHARPFIGATYAQSIDGSIAARNRSPIRLSGEASMRLTHELRACFDVILIGIGTVLSDNPRLTVRRVAGKNPRPIILDTHLRTPLQSNLLQRTVQRAWIVSGRKCSGTRRKILENAGATVFTCDTGADGCIDLAALMDLLSGRRIDNIMVEGGARILTSFIHARLIDQLIITIAPKIVGGLGVIDERGIGGRPYLRLERIVYRFYGKDLVISAQPAWDET